MARMNRIDTFDWFRVSRSRFAKRGRRPWSAASLARPKRGRQRRLHRLQPRNSSSPNQSFDRCTLLAVLARQALIAEAELTPKPGLVDRRGSGAHSDLSLAMMRRSAFAIEPFIRHMAFQSLDEPPTARLRATLATTGRAAETAMLRVTNGSNTHKGAIWTLGLLAAAAAIRFNFDPVAIARTAGRIASLKDPYEFTANAKRTNAKRRTPNAKRAVTRPTRCEEIRRHRRAG